MWDAHQGQVAGERGVVLLEEACRIADRLDRLDQLLKGDVGTWASIAVSRDGTIELRVDAALTEARQQASVLRQILSGLEMRGGDDGDSDGWLDDL